MSETSTETLLRAACADLDRRVRAGESVSAEEYIRSAPEFAASEAALELIFAEFVARVDLGNSPPPDDWVARFPQWERDLRELFQLHEFFAESVDLPKEVSTPNRLGQFDLLEEIGRGADAAVYRAVDRRLGRTVAVKLLNPSGDRPDLSKLCQEGGIGARLQHPNVVPIYEIGEAQGRLYLAMEYLAGGSLRNRTGGRAVSPTEAAALVATVARAIHYAHLMGVVHRDLKPANILLTLEGIPKVADFGLAQVGLRDEGGSVVGTPGYMAPELRQGQPAGPAADIFSLGAILQELVGSDSQSRDLAAIVRKCTREKPEDRYPNAEALATDLNRFVAGEAVSVRAVGFVEWGWKSARRRPAMAGLLGFCLVATALGAALGVRYDLRLRAAFERSEQLSQLYRDQLAETRRTAYALQLSHVDTIRMTDPAAGRTLLDDPLICPPELREFAWYYLRRQCDRNRTTVRIGDPVIRVAVSSKSGAAAVVRDSNGFVAIVRDLTRDRELWRNAGRRPIVAIAFHADGHRLVVGRELESEGPVEISTFDAETGAELKRERCKYSIIALAPASDGVVTVCRDGNEIVVARSFRELSRIRPPYPTFRATLAPDGRRFAGWSGGDSKENRRLSIWDIDGKETASRNLPAKVTEVTFAPDGKTLAVACGSNVYLCNSETLEVSNSFLGHTNAVRSLAFAANGQTLATGAEDFTVRLWDLARGRGSITLRGHDHVVSDVAFTGDGKTFVSGSSDGTLRTWDAEFDRRESLTHSPAEKVLAAAVHPEGKTLATGSTDGTIVLWDVRTRKRVATTQCHRRFAWSVAFSPSGERFATAGPDEPVKVWDTASHRLIRALPRPASEPAKDDPNDQGPNAISVLFLSERDLVSAHRNGRIVCSSIDEGRTIREILAHPGGVHCLALSPDGRRLASGGADHRVRIWNIATWEIQENLEGHTAKVYGVAFDPTGDRVASASGDHTVRLWFLRDRSCLRLNGHTHWPYSVAFTPDGKTLVSGTADRMSNVVGEVKMWDPSTGRALLTIPGQGGPVAILDGGRGLLSADLRGNAYIER